ncbi:MAG: 30S ribosomal protein S8 [Candidatus Hodarchaeales archaeon]|jgi:small subunit ribosomal protein S8
MSNQDTLANALNAIMTADGLGKKSVMIKPASNIIKNVLQVVQEYGGVGEFEAIDDGKSGIIRVQLSGRITKIAAIKPRYPVKVSKIEYWEKIYLPARDFGYLILSTPKGIMSHREAIEKHVGGRLFAYVY